MKIKKSKFFKAFGFGSLAVMMAVAGTFAFAPLGATPSVANASEVGQINTKADGENIKYAPSPLGLDPENDPVIYTTESGLEIKYGGLDLNASLSAGILKGYPYFTMGTFSGKVVNWVVIGRAPDIGVFNSKIDSYLFSTWRVMTKYNNNKYFFSNVYESTTPAGSAIKTVTESKSYIADNYSLNLSEVVSNNEIPSGCVLAISECTLGTSVFNSTASNTSSVSTYGRGCRYRYASDSSTHNTWNNKIAGYLYSSVSNLYNSGLALNSTQKEMIKAQKLNTRYNANGLKLDTYDTDGNTLYPLFPLASSECGTGQNFIYETYFSSDNLRIAYAIGTTTATTYWSRSASSSNMYDAHAIDTGGGDWHGPNVGVSAVYGVRPACVIKLG